jgi:hypothetical protein
MEFTGSIRGRDKKYDFSNLKIGDNMEILPEGNIINFRHKISAAIYQWKKYNGYNWITPVRVINDKIVVFRIK